MLPRKKIDSSLRNNRSINLNLSDHVRFLCGKIWRSPFTK